MLAALDLFGSLLASTARMWRGTMARPGPERPSQPLELYEFEACPFCRLVREALTALDLDAVIHPTPRGGQRFRPRVIEMGGRAQFPYLVDPGNDAAMYESADIVRYLYATYGDRPAPPGLLRLIDVPTSSLASALRFGAGRAARPSRAPERPLELYSFESSPFSRPVRERLCALELPYLLRSMGKALWRDVGPAGWRGRLFPDLPVQGRNRVALLERAGKVQVPYLVDPNTGVEMFESRDILAYLDETYAL